jgi:hypothetical protein
MSRLLLAFVFCIFYVSLLGGTYSAANPRWTEPEPMQWWAKPWPQNAKYIEVKVQVKDGYCLEPVLPFHVEYLDRNGQRLGTLRGEFVIRQRQMCAGVYTLYYEIDTPAASTGVGRMRWSLAGGPRPYGSRGVQRDD